MTLFITFHERRIIAVYSDLISNAFRGKITLPNLANSRWLIAVQSWSSVFFDIKKTEVGTQNTNCF